MNTFRSSLIVVLAIILATMFVSACQPTPEETPEPTAAKPTSVVVGTPVPFEMIENSEAIGTGPEYQGKVPLVVVLAEISDIVKIENTISNQAQQKLRQVDFQEYVVVAVFQGWKPSSGYGVDILPVARLGDRISIYADFIEPVPGMVVSDVETSPYQLIKIRKEGLDGKFIFELIVDEAVIQQTEVTLNQP